MTSSNRRTKWWRTSSASTSQTGCGPAAGSATSTDAMSVNRYQAQTLLHKFYRQAPHLQPKNINGWFWSGSGRFTWIEHRDSRSHLTDRLRSENLSDQCNSSRMEGESMVNHWGISRYEICLDIVVHLSRSHTGYLSQFVSHDVPQPDNAEYLLQRSGVTVEACMAGEYRQLLSAILLTILTVLVLSDWYGDGIEWHDSACYR